MPAHVNVIHILSTPVYHTFVWNISSDDTSVTRKNRQMSINVAQKMISLEKLKILTPLQNA